VQVQLLEPAGGEVIAALSTLPGISELTVDGRSLRARVDSGAVAVPSLITALEQRGVPVASATVARPSLDDVYLRHAGRSFHEAHTNAKEVAA
jgi:ABC-2 type transport system ATP-binding protein